MKHQQPDKCLKRLPPENGAVQPDDFSTIRSGSLNSRKQSVEVPLKLRKYVYLIASFSKGLWGPLLKGHIAAEALVHNCRQTCARAATPF